MPDKRTIPQSWGGTTPHLCEGTAGILALPLPGTVWGLDFGWRPSQAATERMPGKGAVQPSQPSLLRGKKAFFRQSLVALATLTMSFAQFTNLNVRKGDNSRQAMDARLAAESGLAFLRCPLRHVRLPGDPTEPTLLADLPCMWLVCARGLPGTMEKRT